MNCLIRKATDKDADAISRVIISALRESNRQNYSAAIIARVEQSFSPPAVLCFLAQRQVFVATIGEDVIGTASLDQATVRSVFVAPSHQNLGVGRGLMAAVEAAAAVEGVSRLRLRSSITAQSFYQSLGYSSIGDEYHGAERTIVMEKSLKLHA
jgi:GNAT superfamily N-acetyltransferase